MSQAQTSGKEAAAKAEIVIGVFYELPDGRIARTFGAGRGIVRYYFDDGHGERSAATHEVASTWKLTQLADFPNARDPRLPYDFDLHYDIKHLSELNLALQDAPAADVEDLRRLIAKHQLTALVDGGTEDEACSTGSELEPESGLNGESRHGRDRPGT